MLSLASAQTTIQLSLRNPLDKAVAKTPGTALGRLFNGGVGLAPNVPQERPAPRPAPVVAAAPPKKEAPFVMEIISGTTKKELKFENAGEAK
jgi:pilus assembly protein CpaB